MTITSTEQHAGANLMHDRMLSNGEDETILPLSPLGDTCRKLAIDFSSVQRSLRLEDNQTNC